MLILSIDSATKVLGVALGDENSVFAQSCLNVGKTHSARLLPVTADMMSYAERSFSELDAVAVTVGPGSFTGLRIGIATAKGLAHALSIPVIPIITLDALAQNVLGCADNICPILDARKGEVYCAVYDKDCNKILDYSALSVDELSAYLQKRDGSVMLLGDAADIFYDRLQNDLGGRLKLAAPQNRMFMAGSILQLAARDLAAGKGVCAADVEAFYLRLSEAERKMLANTTK